MSTEANVLPTHADRPLGRSTFELTTSAWLPQPVAVVFPFFGDARNLDMLTPPSLRFEITSPGPIEMRAGAIIDYRIRLHGIRMRWRTRISVWEPNRRFIDEQLRGPYLEWIHTHAFEPVDGGTLMSDTVRYRVPGGALVSRFFVQREVTSIFRYRVEALRRQFGCVTNERDVDVNVVRLR
jgi:ligand-binding SRPBCC domain-containing protein